MPDQKWEEITRAFEAAKDIRRLKDHEKKSTIQQAVTEIKAIYEELDAADPDHSVRSLLDAENFDEYEDVIAWTKIMNLGKEEMMEDEDEDKGKK
jgi:5-methylcytosine-specific restriction endonuclease McrBC regulatory subunit McrC